MKLWLLSPRTDLPNDNNPWQGYDRAVGFVIRARNESMARKLASEESGAENPASWLDPACSRCERLLDAGEPGVILRDFNSA